MTNKMDFNRQMPTHLISKELHLEIRYKTTKKCPMCIILDYSYVVTLSHYIICEYTCIDLSYKDSIHNKITRSESFQVQDDFQLSFAIFSMLYTCCAVMYI